MGTPMIEIFNTKWYEDDLAVTLNVHGAILERNFGIQTSIGEVTTHGSDCSNKYLHLDYFLFMFLSEKVR